MVDHVLDEVLHNWQAQSSRGDEPRRPAVAKLPELLTVAQVAEFLQVHHRSVRRWIRIGRVSATRLPGGGLRIAKSELLDLLEPLGQRPASALPTPPPRLSP